MRLLLLLGFAGWLDGVAPRPATPGLKLIDDLDRCVQVRFQVATPEALGMSRIVLPSSFGRHFQPNFLTGSDFGAANESERQVVAALEDRHMQVGFYLFGRAIDGSDAAAPNYRALKGPGAMTRGTPRPSWYPGPALLNGVLTQASADTLPDWKAVYPVARRAMRSFEDGGKGFEAACDSWQIAARPVVASQERCVGCHKNVELNQAIGGVLYAYRRSE